MLLECVMKQLHFTDLQINKMHIALNFEKTFSEKLKSHYLLFKIAR